MPKPKRKIRYEVVPSDRTHAWTGNKHGWVSGARSWLIAYNHTTKNGALKCADSYVRITGKPCKVVRMWKENGWWLCDEYVSSKEVLRALQK